MRANCVAVCYVRVRDSWGTFRRSCWMRKYHVNPELTLNYNDNHFPLRRCQNGHCEFFASSCTKNIVLKKTNLKLCGWQNGIMGHC